MYFMRPDRADDRADATITPAYFGMDHAARSPRPLAVRDHASRSLRASACIAGS